MTSWDSAKGRLLPGAEWYAKQGWRILPCYGIVDGRCTCNGLHTEPKDVGKHPSISEWQVYSSSDPATVTKWWESSPDSNIAVFCKASGFLVIDIDPRSGGEASFEKFEELVNWSLPKTVEALTGEYSYKGKTARGRHLYYKIDQGEHVVGNLGKELPGIDIKHNGYVLVAPSRHFSGNTYEWRPGQAPWEIEMAEAPAELLEVLRKKNRRGGSSLGQGDWSFMDNLEYNGERVDIEKMLEDGIDEGSRAVDIYRLACALSNKMGVDTEYKRLALETLMIRFNHEKVRPPMELEGPNSLLMHVRRAMDFVAENGHRRDGMFPGLLTEWARKSQAESQAAASGGQDRVGTSDPDDVDDRRTENLPGTLGGSVKASVISGVSVSQAFAGSNIDVPKDPDALSEAEGGTPGMRTLSDTGNGRRLIDTFGSAVRYTPGLGWFHWDGEYWKPDVEELEMRELAKRLSTVIASEVVNYTDLKEQNAVVKWAEQAKSNGRLSGAIESATSDPRVTVGVSTWDNDAHLLGVQNGVIDLRTGDLLRGRPDLYITKRAPVAYTPGLPNIRWQEFLDFATGGDKELQDWLQRAAGYSLTGLRTQDVMFLVYGPPGSGKNTLVEAIVKCMGTQQYAWPLDSSILAQGDGQAHGSDLYHWAELRGRRLVWVDELPESERMKENSVKKLTGSSEISARSPGEKPFTFQSQAKLWVTTNHRPIINDDAMWRRLRPIPLLKTPEKPDPDLKEYFFDPEGALPAVLSWAVEGAIKYLGSSARDPLGWCTAVSEAAEVYRKNEDRIGMFLNEETKEVDGAVETVKRLYAIYRFWSEGRGEKPLTQIGFHRKLADRGLEIVGQGSRAEVVGRILVPRAVQNNGVDWEDAVLRAN